MPTLGCRRWPGRYDADSRPPRLHRPSPVMQRWSKLRRILSSALGANTPRCVPSPTFPHCCLAPDLYSWQKRFFDALDSLISPVSAKKPRIYPSSPLQALARGLTITSSTPLPPLPPPELYAPFSPLPLLSRLRTFTYHSFPDLETPLDAVSLAKLGWICSSRTAVSCGHCKRIIDLASLFGITDAKLRKEVSRRLGGALGDKHTAACPWRVKQCPGESATA